MKNQPLPNTIYDEGLDITFIFDRPLTRDAMAERVIAWTKKTKDELFASWRVKNKDAFVDDEEKKKEELFVGRKVSSRQVFIGGELPEAK